jgi:hypothetical protein
VSTKNTIVIVGVNVFDGSAVREHNRCGVKRIENALRFTATGAKRIAAGYPGGYAKTVD